MRPPGTCCRSPHAAPAGSTLPGWRSRRVERIAQTRLGGEVVVARTAAACRSRFSSPMPCSPRQHAARGHASGDDLVARGVHALDHAGSRASNTSSGWRLPSPAWNTLSTMRSWRVGDRVDLAQHLDERRRVPRCRAGSSSGLIRAIAPNADLRPFHNSARSASSRRPAPSGPRGARRSRRSRAASPSTPCGEPVELDEQRRRGVDGEAGVDVVLDGPGAWRPSSRAPRAPCRPR